MISLLKCQENEFERKKDARERDFVWCHALFVKKMSTGGRRRKNKLLGVDVLLKLLRK